MKNLKELSLSELQQINGGESFWYRVGQAVGYVAGVLHNVNDAHRGISYCTSSNQLRHFSLNP
ncbi:bacteriocin [Chryseobacterium fluminis]|uniref:bacteriocin n=1 Tax=Chryseobacterium fluminis TaxID=2983606 RepID=UPI002259A87D|nr:bacteriocin [Chryseobacterium sp. MMS21-Ot14]UZT97513.1 bacteriocin [Chryseobacterium sp. MMS21-Ot14]